MRQDPSLESAKSSAPQGLHPTLQATLNSLDAQLEEELTRYRRQQAGRPLPPRALTRQQTRKPLDLISVGATGGRTQPQAAKPSTPPSTSSVDSIPYVPTQSFVPPSNHPGSEQAGQNDSWSGSSSLAIATRPTELDQESENSANFNETSSLTSTTVESDVWGQLTNPEPAHPGDYLESSEELLRSLAEEEAKVRAERGFVDSLLTPVGVGSMLLLLLSSATFGYVIMNPSSLSSLGFNRLFNDSKPTTAQAPAGTTSAANGTGPGIPNAPNLASQEFKDLSLGSLSTLPTNPGASGASTTSQSALPNLKGSTAKPVNGSVPNSTVPGKLSTLTTTLPAALTSPTATANAGGQSGSASAPSTRSMSITPPPAPARIYQPPTVTRVAPPPARSYSPPPAQSYSPPARSYSPPPAVERPAPAPEPPSVSPDVRAPEPAASSSTPDQGDYYHVVTDYNSDRALEQARQVVPDAYVRNFPEGAQVQLGAFNDAQKAQGLVQELQEKGIPAQVQQR